MTLNFYFRLFYLPNLDANYLGENESKKKYLFCLFASFKIIEFDVFPHD